MSNIVNLDGTPYEIPEQPESSGEDAIGLFPLLARLIADKDKITAVICIIRHENSDDEYLDGTEMLMDTQKAMVLSALGMVQSRDVYLYDDEELEDDEADDND